MITSWPEREPSYNGVPLREWVINLQGEFSVDQVKALDSIGTNAVPYLLEWFRYDTPKWKAMIYKGRNRVRQYLNKKPLEDKRQVLAEEATIALWRLSNHTPEIAAECQTLSSSSNTPPNVRRRADWLLMTLAALPNHARLQFDQAPTNAPGQ